MSQDSARMLWQELAIQQPWSLKDKQPNNRDCLGLNLFDGGEVHLQLISKGEIKELDFFEPQMSEKICPGGNEYRIRLLALIKTLKEYVDTGQYALRKK